MSSALPTPYGGALVSPVIAPSGAADRLQTLKAAASWDLTPSQLVDLELLLTGALSPLRGFMTAEHAERTAAEGRLADGTPWPTPIVLTVSEPTAATLAPRAPLVLRDLEGVPLALVAVDEVWQAPRDPAASDAGGWRVGGLIEGLRLPIHHDFAALRATAAETRATLARRGWTRTLAVPVAGALSPELVRETLEAASRLDAGVLVIALQPPVGLEGTDHFARLRAVRTAFAAVPSERGQLLLLPWNGAPAVSRDRVLRAIVARNLGCTHLAQPQGASTADVADIGIATVGVTAPLEEIERADLGLDPPDRRGVTVFLTGLSGSGKSTIANVLRVRLLEQGARRVTLLDGDVVRKHLSSELGFSREHRELNVRRIAYVASEITKHGGIAICAPIAPYDAVRHEARRMVEAVGDFVLVFVDTPLEVCEQRDPKGLYAKARAGLLPAFTGVSDPYERPDGAEIVLDTTTESAGQAADRVLALLRARGYLG
jgi:sulfate adenylyltransferase